MFLKKKHAKEIDKSLIKIGWDINEEVLISY